MKKQILKREQYKTITISPEIWRELTNIKLDNHFKSLDETIMYILGKIKEGKGGRRK